jgi:hypothetical protein
VGLTVSQYGDALQKLLERKAEGIMNDQQLRRLANRLAEDMERTQDRNRRATESHRRRRNRILKSLGIDCSEIDQC